MTPLHRLVGAAARLTGEDNRTALVVGTLMNARGLIELIIINLGLEKGVIQPAKERPPSP